MAGVVVDVVVVVVILSTSSPSSTLMLVVVSVIRYTHHMHTQYLSIHVVAGAAGFISAHAVSSGSTACEWPCCRQAKSTPCKM